MSFKIIKRRDIEPMEDYGFFGPDSVAWKVWSYPTAFAIGSSRAVAVEMLNPDNLAAVAQAGGVYQRTRSRYDRTLRYFVLVTFGETRTAMRVSDVLVKVHAKAVGTEPISGNRYDANDPASQLWVHLTAWHSILYAYEKYGPGKLTAEEEGRYWEECAVAAELQTCGSESVPRTRAAVHEYFESMRPRIAGSEEAQKMMAFLTNVENGLPDTPRALKPLRRVVARLHQMAIIATLPGWMRPLTGLNQPKWIDALITPIMRLEHRLVNASNQATLQLLNLISPSSMPVAAAMIYGIEPKNAKTLTPAQARERYGILKPSAEYARFRAMVDAKNDAKNTSVVGPARQDSIELLGPVPLAA